MEVILVCVIALILKNSQWNNSEGFQYVNEMKTVDTAILMRFIRKKIIDHILAQLWASITMILKMTYSSQPAILLWGKKKQHAQGRIEEDLLVHFTNIY